MTNLQDDADRLARETEAAAKKAASDLNDATASNVDEARELARQAFEKIKAARLRAEKAANS